MAIKSDIMAAALRKSSTPLAHSNSGNGNLRPETLGVTRREGSPAAGIAAVNSIGNLGGYFGPKIFGQLRDWTGTDFAGLIFLAGCAVVGAIIVLALGHNPALERPAQTAPTE